MSVHFDKEAFSELALQALGIFPEPKTLKSQRQSHWYVNWRTTCGDAHSLDFLAKQVVLFADEKGLEPDCFYGVPEGATKLGVEATMELARQSPNYGPGSHVVPMGRGKPKTGHGDPKDRLYVGAPRGRVVIVEDVTTTGGSSLDMIAGLKATPDVEIVGLIGLTNRMEVTPIPRVDNQRVVDGFAVSFERATGLNYFKVLCQNSNGLPALTVKEAMNLAKVPYFAMSGATDLLPEKIARDQVDGKIVSFIRNEFNAYGAAPLDLGDMEMVQ